MHLWIVHQHATPPSQNGYPRSYFLARALLRKGHRTTIVASGFNHKTLVDLLAPGEPMRRESYDDVDFLWLRTPGYAGNGARRLWNMIHFAWQARRLVPAAGVAPPDVVLGSSPPPFAALAAARLAARYRTPFVLEIRDLWPQTLIDLGNMPAWHPAVRLMLPVERKIYRAADRIVTVLPNAAPQIVARGGPAGRIDLIPNGVDASGMPPPAPPPDDGVFTVLYAGAHGLANGLDVLLEVAARLQRDPHAARIRLKFVGEGPEKPRLQRRAAAAGLANIEFAAAVPNAEVHGVMAQADAFIVNVRRRPLYKYGVSSIKFFDYMAMARPTVVAISAFNNPIAEAGAGLAVPADDADGLACAILKLAAMSAAERWEMGLRGRRYVEEHHDFGRLAERLEAVLEAACAAPPLAGRARRRRRAQRRCARQRSMM